MSVATTWPANAARQKNPGPNSASTATTATVVSGICATGSPSTMNPLVSSRHAWPETTPDGLEATSRTCGPHPALRATSKAPRARDIRAPQ